MSTQTPYAAGITNQLTTNQRTDSLTLSPNSPPLFPTSSPRYNPFVQARSRIDQLRRLGHSVDKVEFILMGGTFMSLPLEYRDFFVRNLHDALSGQTSKDVSEAVLYSEHSSTKCIGLTIETCVVRDGGGSLGVGHF